MECVRCKLDVQDGPYCALCGWNQSLQPERCTVKSLYMTWSKRHYPRIDEKTKEGYERAWNGWIAQYQDSAIQEMGLDEWQEIIDQMCGYSLSAQKKVQGLISQLCKTAIMRNMIKTNYANGLVLDGVESDLSLVFDSQQIHTLIKCAESFENPHCFTARITLILIFTGLRPNELFNLRRSNIHIEEACIVGGSKTAAGQNRIIPILKVIRKYIIELYLKTAFVQDDYLFRGVKGAKLNLRNWRERCFYPMTLDLNLNSFDQILNKKEVPHYTPYSARGTFASIAYEAGVDPEVLKRIMGHTKFTTTAKFYIKTNAQYLEKELSKLSAIY